MGEVIEQRKTRIINEINQFDDLKDIEQIESLLQQLRRQAQLEKEVLRPLKNDITLEELLAEKKYQPIDRKKFNRLVAEMDIQEPLEELLAQLD